MILYNVAMYQAHLYVIGSYVDECFQVCYCYYNIIRTNLPTSYIPNSTYVTTFND